MKFELTEALFDDILFAMEDQEGEFYLDTVEGLVAGGIDGPDFFDEDLDDDDGEGGERYIELPEWDSASGFRLMERFAAGFRNPLIRDELSSALNQGRGVFRAFKNTLSRYPEAEKYWFSFKEKEMRNEILRWYNALREEWGLEQIGMEPEETKDLVLEDFNFRPFTKEDLPEAEALHRQCLADYGSSLGEAGSSFPAEALLNASKAFRSQEALELSFDTGLAVESAGGEFAGYISAVIRDSVLYVQGLEVKAEYRGLGVGEALLDKFLGSLDPSQVQLVLMDLPSCSEGFSRVLLRESFKPYTVRYWLRLPDR
ncbi:MAG: UPF0158 family protein [Treponema sp.]|nr:UPF0158 family protein [Treponema sp.]